MIETDIRPVADDTHLRVLQALAGRRFAFEAEKRLQAEIAEAFAQAGITATREVALFAPPEVDVVRGELVERAFGRPLGAIDFLAGDVGVEIKIRGSAMDVHRQLKRYAESERVSSLVLLTARMIALPPCVLGKRLTVFDLGRAWL